MSNEGKVGQNAGAEEAVEEPSAGGDRSVVDLLASGELDGVTDILILGPAGRLTEEETCAPFFANSSLDEKNVLFISLTRSAEDRLRLLREHGLGFPSNVGIVTAGDRFSSATTESGGSGEASSNVTVRAVSDPSDLPDLGITIGKFVDEWAANDRETVVCFHSVSVLLQYVDLRRVFRFLHVLKGRFATADATVHYHMNADAHDQQTIATLYELFDTVVEFEQGNGVSVRR